MKYPVEKQISRTLEYCKWLGYYYNSLVQFLNYSNAKNYDQIKGLYSIKNNMGNKGIFRQLIEHIKNNADAEKI